MWVRNSQASWGVSTMSWVCNNLHKQEWEWTWQNPTGDDWVSSAHECGSRAKVASSMTALAH